MQKEITKLVIVPMDGSKDAFKALNYLQTLYPAHHNLKWALLHVLPALPPIIVEEAKTNHRTAHHLKLMQDKHTIIGNHILDDSQKHLVRKGFKAGHIEKRLERKQVGIARDINAYVEHRQADALVLSGSSKNWLEGFFTGEVTAKLMEITRICPIWVVKGEVKSTHVLIAVDGSSNSLRSVDHAGFMLAGTQSRITLMHVAYSMLRFFPKEVVQEIGDLEDTWSQETNKAIQPSLEKARDMLIQAGISPDKIDVKVVDGGRRLAKILLDEAQKRKAGTIVLGRRGKKDVGDYTMGSTTRKIFNQAENMAVWVVS
jgi:nucleotide-binding universal stress UspA family protein